MGAPTRKGVGAAVVGILCGSLAAFAPGTPAGAAEWFAEGSASAGGKFDDNVRLRANNKQAVFAATFNPRLDVHGRGPLWDLNFIGDVSVAQYSEDSALNSADPRLRVEASRRSQLGLFRLSGEASRTSTLVTEATDTGAFETNTARDLFQLSPSWAYAVTAQDTIRLGASWTEALFESNALSDYRLLTADVAWSRQVTPTDVLSLAVVADRFESRSTIELHSHAVSVLGSWEHTFSERLQASVTAGPQFFTTETPVNVGGNLVADEDSALGYLVDARMDYRLAERTSVDARVSHRIEPTSGGTPLQRNKVEFAVRHQFLQRLWASLRAYYQLDSSPISDPTGSRDRDYFSIEPGLTWALAEEWDLSASYRLRTQDTAGEERTFSNAFFVTVAYRPERWIIGH